VKNQVSEDVKTLVFTILHQRLVQEQMLKISQEIQRRATNHDNSKLSLVDEFEGLCEINYIAREQGFGSPAYQESLKSEMIRHHWATNDHHPEHFGNIERMGLFQIIEMVCDWKAVSIQKSLDFDKMLEEQQARFIFAPEQVYLIKLIARELA
jgi:hypothetical protein